MARSEESRNVNVLVLISEINMVKWGDSLLCQSREKAKVCRTMYYHYDLSQKACSTTKSVKLFRCFMP